MDGDDQLFYKPDQAWPRLAIGRTRLFEALRSGELASVKWGGARLIAAADLDDFARRLREGAVAGATATDRETK